MFIDEVKKCQLCSFKSGEPILAQGDSTDFLFYLISGVCIRTALTKSGNEIVFEVRKASEDISSILGMTAPLLEMKEYVCSFFAVTDCDCYKIPKEMFLHFFDNNIDFLHQVIRVYSEESVRLYHRFMAHSENSVANFVCELIDQLSETLEDGTRYLSSKYTNEMLSKMSGVTNVTIARVISYLKKEEIISRNKGGLFIENEVAFAEYCEGKQIKYH